MNQIEAAGSKRLSNSRHEAFCIAYTGKHRRNATQSYVAAGYSSKNMEAVRINACRLLTNDNILNRINFLNDEAVKREMLHVREAVQRLGKIATARLSDYMDEDGNIDPAKVADPELSEAVQEMTISDTKHGRNVRIKLKDDMKALELLGLTDKPTVESNQNNVFIIER